MFNVRRGGNSVCRWVAWGAPQQESRRNAGHSKWANIKHTKALKDGQKSAMFTKIGRMMRVAIVEGRGADPAQNPQLRRLMTAAQDLGSPAAAVATLLATAQRSTEPVRSAMFDFRGPGNCIIVADVVTVSLTKTRQLVLNILRKNNGSYADGTSRHLFDKKGVVSAGGGASTLAEEHAIDAGAEDVAATDDAGNFRFVCALESLSAVSSRLTELGWTVRSADVEYVPHTLVTLSDEQMAAASALCDKLEENPDIVRLYDNIA